MSSNPFAGDMARLVGPRPAEDRRAQIAQAADSAIDHRAQIRADSERRAMEQAGMLPRAAVDLGAGRDEMRPGDPVSATPVASPVLDLIGLDLQNGEAMTTRGRFTLTDDELSLAASIALDAVNRHTMEQLRTLASQYKVPNLLAKMQAAQGQPPELEKGGADEKLPTITDAIRVGGGPPIKVGRPRRYPKPEVK